MSENPIITQLTPEQEALIPVYQEKWRKIALSTEPIDRQKAADAVKTAYKWFGEKEPEIIFVDSPYAAFYNIYELSSYELPEEDLLRQIRHPLIKNQIIPIDTYVTHRVIDKRAKDSQAMLEESLCSFLNALGHTCYIIYELKM